MASTLKFSVFLLLLLVLFMLAGVLPVADGTQDVIFRTPVFIALLFVLACTLVFACFKQRFSFKNIGFYLAHLGVAAILVGAGIGFVFGSKTSCTLPVDEQHKTSEIILKNGKAVPLEFDITVTSFDVDFYDPPYNLYRPVTAENGSQVNDYEFVRRIRFRDDKPVQVLETITVLAGDLKDGSGQWVPQHYLENGWMLEKGRAMPRTYTAGMRITGKDDDTLEKDLVVNHPVSYGGWRFYLMSYDMDAAPYIVVSARRDPGRVMVIYGIWAVIIGTAIVCFRKERKVYAAS
jgi:hypothetical protein